MLIEFISDLIMTFIGMFYVKENYIKKIFLFRIDIWSLD